MESLRILSGLIQKIQIILQDRVTKENSIAAYLVAKQIIRLGRKSGWLFVALYLKQCSATLMQFRGGNTPVDRNLSVPVSLTRSGIPRIIPTFHRRMILRRDEKADRIVQYYLSIFTVSRLIPLSKRISKHTFTSIIEPASPHDATHQVVDELKGSFHSLVDRYIPHARRIPLQQGLTFEPTWKALPTSRIVLSVLYNRIKLPMQEIKKYIEIMFLVIAL